MRGILEITLYSRPNCCLCEDAKSALLAAMPEVKIIEIDVDSDSSLCNLYGNDIPVAIHDGQELFRHRFDSNCLRMFGNLNQSN